MKSRISTADLFAKAKVGLGASKQVGSDCYGYYISFVDPKTKTIGLYTPKHWFKRDWTEGHMEHDPFDPKAKPEFWLQAYRGKWYYYDMKTKTRLHTQHPICIGHCSFYQNPSY